MSFHSVAPALSQLPKLFEGQPGRVSPELLKTLCSLRSKPSKRVRELLTLCDGARLGPNDDVYEKFSQAMTGVEFRMKWYAASEAKRLQQAPVFYLVDDFLRLRHALIEQWSHRLPDFLQRRMVKGEELIFPVLEKISILAEHLSVISEKSVFDAALLAWSLLERTKWGSNNYPSEKSLSEFENSLHGVIAGPQYSELRDLLSVPAWRVSAVTQGQGTGSSQQRVRSKTPPTPIPAIAPNPNVLKFTDDLSAIEIALSEYEKTRLSLSHRVAELEEVATPEPLLKEIGSTVLALEGVWERISIASTKTAQRIYETVQHCLHTLRINLLPPEDLPLTPRNLHAWQATQRGNLDCALPIINLVSAGNNELKVLIESARGCHSTESISISELPALAAKISALAKLIDEGEAASGRLNEHISRKYLDFCWSPLSDPGFQEGDWNAIGKLKIYRREFGKVLGICVRVGPATLINVFQTSLEETVLSLDAKKLEHILDVARYLTLGQIESLDSGTRPLNALLAIIELHGHLAVAATAPTDAFAYWSASPLNEYTSQSEADTFHAFVHSIFAASGNDPDARLLVSELRLRIISARGRLHAGTGTPNENLAVEKLRNILTLRRRGGNTYAELWNRAHASMFAPLFRKLTEGKIDEIPQDIALLRNEFQIEDHLVSWKSSIQEHLRKRSEYDKHIRAQVASKVEELSAWAEEYSASAIPREQLGAPRHTALETAIKKVYASEDPRCELLRLWFDVLLDDDADEYSVPWCPSSSRDAQLQLPLVMSKRSVFHPRTACSAQPTFFEILSDELIESVGFNRVPQLARAYAEQERYEDYFALAAAAEGGISPDLDRKVEAAVDELEDSQRRRINALEVAQSDLTKSKDEFFYYILDLKRLLAEQKWVALDRELTEVELLLSNLKLEQERNAACQRVLAEIRELGGEAPEDADSDELYIIKQRLMIDIAPRRRHISSIHRLSSLSKSAPTVAASAVETIAALESGRLMPAASHSEYLSYVLEQCIVPLTDELKRSKTLLPSYGKKLEALTLSLLTNIREPAFLKSESSPLLRMLEETTDVWTDLANLGEEGIDTLYSKFAGFNLSIFAEGYVNGVESYSREASIPLRPFNADTALPAMNGVSAISRLIEKMKAVRPDVPVHESSDDDLGKAVRAADWNRAANIAFAAYAVIPDVQSARALEMLANFAVCHFRHNDAIFGMEEYAAMFYLVNRRPTAVGVRSLLATKNSKGLAGELAARFIGKVAANVSAALAEATLSDQLQGLCANLEAHSHSRVLLELAFGSPVESDSLMARNFWDYFSGDARQAESRAQFMNLLWQSSVPTGLACCLTYTPIEIPRRKADALASIADQALATGRFELLQSFLDLRKTITAKPFQIFVDFMLRRVPVQTEYAAQLALEGKMEYTSGRSMLRGILCITPRKIDCPDTITIRLSPQSPVRFEDSSLEMFLVGPFIERTCTPVVFEIINRNATTFSVELGCEATSITGRRSSFSAELSVDLPRTNEFRPISSDELEEAFSSFPEYQMRGNEYVARRDDERKIEKSLFSSKTVRSLWISSPRRSGKTSTLYKILDSYSHKAGRDNAVVYLTLDASFSDNAEFNTWIWKRLRTTSANKELRELFFSFDELGRTLPWNADTGTFLGALADQLFTAKCNPNRVIFLIDETDKFASMYFQGAQRRDAAVDIMWQIRHLIGERRDIGFVFAGSSAAKRIFVTNSDAPFFNSITLLELTPFSCSSPSEAASAREIVSPARLSHDYVMPDDSLAHLLWICAGIPYYMKLVAGATYAVARQSHILVSDINDGLRALLAKATGVSKLDDMSGDPGSDELRTMAIESGSEKLLTLAVLYSVAEAHSPVGGHRILRTNVTSAASPMVSRYRLPKKVIDRGLELAVELGLLKISSDKIPEIYFAIPILGESIRGACGRLWSSIDHELEELSKESA